MIDSIVGIANFPILLVMNDSDKYFVLIVLHNVFMMTILGFLCASISFNSFRPLALISYKFGILLFDQVLFVPLLLINLNYSSCLFSLSDRILENSYSVLYCDDKKQLILSIIAFINLFIMIVLKLMNTLIDFNPKTMARNVQFENVWPPVMILGYQALVAGIVVFGNVFKWKLGGLILLFVLTLIAYWNIVSKPLFHSKIMNKTICVFWGGYLISSIVLIYNFFARSTIMLGTFAVLFVALVIYVVLIELKSFKILKKHPLKIRNSESLVFYIKHLLMLYHECEQVQRFDRLLQFIYNHRVICSHPDCELTNVLSDISKKGIKGEALSEFLKSKVQNFVDASYHRIISNSESDETIVINFCFFLSEVADKKTLAFSFINQYSKTKSYTISDQYRLHCLNRIILSNETDGLQKSLKRVSTLNFKKKSLHNSILNLYKQLTSSGLDFWENVKQDELDYQKLTKLASSTFFSFENLRRIILSLNFKDQEDLKFLYVFSYFLKIFFYKEKESDEIVHNVTINLRSINDLQNDEVEAFVKKDLSEYSVPLIIVDVSVDNKFIIINTNPLANKLFCTEEASLYNKELNYILPEWLGDIHNQLVANYKKVPANRGQTIKKVAFGRSFTNHIFPLVINVKYLVDSNTGREYMLTFMTTDKNFDDKYFLVIDSSYNIMDTTVNCNEYFGMNSRTIFQYPDINFWIKDLPKFIEEVSPNAKHQLMTFDVKLVDTINTKTYQSRDFLIEVMKWNFEEVSKQRFIVVMFVLQSENTGEKDESRPMSMKKAYSIPVQEKNFNDLLDLRKNLNMRYSSRSGENIEEGDHAHDDDNFAEVLENEDENVLLAKKSEKYQYKNIKLLVLRSNRLFEFDVGEIQKEEDKEDLQDEMRVFSLNYVDTQENLVSQSEKNENKFLTKKLDEQTYVKTFENFYPFFNVRNLTIFFVAFLFLWVGMIVADQLFSSFYFEKRVINTQINQILNSKMNHFLHVINDLETLMLVNSFSIKIDPKFITDTIMPKINDRLKQIKASNEFIQNSNYLYYYYERTANIYFLSEDSKQYDLYVLEELIISKILDLLDKANQEDPLEAFGTINDITFFIVSNVLNYYFILNDDIIENNTYVYNQFLQETEYSLQIMKIIFGVFIVVCIILYYLFLIIIHRNNLKVFKALLLLSDQFIVDRIDSINVLMQLTNNIVHSTADAADQDHPQKSRSHKIIKSYRKKSFKNKSILVSYKSIFSFLVLIGLFASYAAFFVIEYNSQKVKFMRIFDNNYLSRTEKVVLMDYLQLLFVYIPDNVMLISEDKDFIINDLNSSLVDSINRMYILHLLNIDETQDEYILNFNTIFFTNFCNTTTIYDTDNVAPCNDRQKIMGNQGLSSVVYNLQENYFDLKLKSMNKQMSGPSLSNLLFLRFLTRLDN